MCYSKPMPDLSTPQKCDAWFKKELAEIMDTIAPPADVAIHRLRVRLRLERGE
jgi:hypothetical protein